MAEANLTDDAPILKEYASRHSIPTVGLCPKIWITAAWFADAHQEHPDFAVYRDIAMLYWSSMLPPENLRDAQTTVDPKMLEPTFFGLWCNEKSSTHEASFAVQVRLGRVKVVDRREMGWNRKSLGSSEGYFPVDSWKNRLSADQQLASGGNIQADETNLLFTNAKHLPSFGGVLSTEEAFRLASLMTTRHLRIPLLLHFFSDRTAVLVHNSLQRLLMGVLFEPSCFEGKGVQFARENILATTDALDSTLSVDLGPLTNIPIHPSDRSYQTLFATTGGLLHEELLRCPAPIVAPFLKIIEQIKARAWELTCDIRSPHFIATTWAVVCGARMEGHIRTAIERMTKERFVDSGPLTQARDFLKTFREVMMTSANSFHALLTSMLIKAGNDVCATTAIHGYLILTRAFADEDEMCGQLMGKKEKEFTTDSNALLGCGYVSIFSSGSFINLFLNSVSGELTKLGITMEKLPIPNIFGEGAVENSVMEKPRVALLTVPWHDVFTAIVRHREGLVNWLVRIERIKSCLVNGKERGVSAIDVVLSHVLMITQRRAKCDLVKWICKREKMECVRWIESPHPYPNMQELYTKICFPGASHITITFDHPTGTEAKSLNRGDSLNIFHDETLSRQWACYSGDEGWPGLHGKDPLVIPADSIVMKFQSDESVNNFGFKMRIVAPVNADLVKTIYNGGWKHIEEMAALVEAISQKHCDLLVDGGDLVDRPDSDCETPGNLCVERDSRELTVQLVERAVAEAWNQEVGACVWLVRYFTKSRNGDHHGNYFDRLNTSNIGKYCTGTFESQGHDNTL